MELPTTKISAKRKSPKQILIYGRTKIGKTTKCAELENNLILDFEHGTDLIDAIKIDVSGYGKNPEEKMNLISEILIELIKNKNNYNYKYCTIDTIDKMSEIFMEYVIFMYNKNIEAQNKTIVNELQRKSHIKDLSDVPYGVLWSEWKNTVIKFLNKINEIFPHVIIISQRSTEYIEINSKIIEVDSLSIPNVKLKNRIFQDCDAIGLMYWEKDTPKISFMAKNELSEASSRCEHLKNKILDFYWENIFID